MYAPICCDRARLVLLAIACAVPLVLVATPSSAAISMSTNRGCMLANCHGTPGGDRTLPDGSRGSAHVDEGELESSAHRGLACLECHTDIVAIPHEAALSSVNCEACHYESNPRGAPNIDQFRQYEESIHGERAREGDPKAPRCSTCHGQHNIKGKKAKDSRVHRQNEPSTCGECHDEQASEFQEGVHGTDLATGNLDVPSCVTCHGIHRIRPHTDPESPVHESHIAETCSSCHGAVTIADKYDFSVKRVETYAGSFHGFASKFGVTSVANCASCHGIHRILPHTDERSQVHPSNLGATCGQRDCHPKAVAGFASGQVHLGVAAPAPLGVRLIRVLYIVLIAGIIGGMLLHNAFDLAAQVRRRKSAAGPEA
ncbi:hypothetical protein FJZ36_07455 [Candidatus Poribacteria bacterium]|nr:hypothetical protein [Candidatus Poribacteria bacterium]